MNPDTLKELLAAATPGPWTGHNMTHADQGRQMTPEEIGEYVCNSVKMGDPDRFLFVSAPHEDGGAVDVCHTGNGPRGQANTDLIALAPQIAADNIALQAEMEAFKVAARKVLPLMEAASREEVTDCADWDEAEALFRAALTEPRNDDRTEDNQ